ncbi:hypothetical protein [Nakamurella deserti]|uniref:hypothetical protein n=1 Tax=Nakamurella deserti TaxID=2164074 RepID=UPI000DBE5938|nr:hypothetical protein [Nakamurella deserti]
MARNARLARLRLIPAVGVAGAVLALSGCGAGQIAQTAQQVAAIDGANGTAGEVAVRDVRLAPTESYRYEPGADIPVKLWLSNTSLNPDELTGVTTEAAEEVVVEGDTDIQPQTLREVNSETDTTIVVTGLRDELPYGKSIPMTFSFASGGTISVNVPIEIPEQRSTEPRETVNILPEEHSDIWFGEGHEGEAGHEGTEEGH